MYIQQSSTGLFPRGPWRTFLPPKSPIDIWFAQVLTCEMCGTGKTQTNTPVPDSPPNNTSLEQDLEQEATAVTHRLLTQLLPHCHKPYNKQYKSFEWVLRNIVSNPLANTIAAWTQENTYPRLRHQLPGPWHGCFVATHGSAGEMHGWLLNCSLVDDSHAYSIDQPAVKLVMQHKADPSG